MDVDELTGEELKQMQEETPVETEETPVEETPAEEPPVEEKPPETPKVEVPEVNPEAMVPSFRLREVTEANQELKEKMTKMESAFDVIKEKLKAPAPAPTVPYDEDPTEHIRQQAEINQQATTEKVTQLEDSLKNLTEGQKQQYAEMRFIQTRDGHVTAFKASTPDYDAASDYISEMKSHEYKAVGITDVAEIEKNLMAEWNNFAYKVMSTGGDPAKAMYELAIANGYKANGAPVKTPAEKKIETIEKGQAASTSLAAAGGGSGEPSLEQIADMSVEDLSKVFDDPDGWEKLLTGAG